MTEPEDFTGGEHPPGPLVLPASLVEAQARAEAAEAKLAEFENAIGWSTSCLSCSRVLDSAYTETMRREKAEAKLAAIAAYVEARKGDAGLSWMHALDILATTGSDEKENQ
jgi:hypothetical protein